MRRECGYPGKVRWGEVKAEIEAQNLGMLGGRAERKD
jgi:hypothetical protein